MSGDNYQTRQERLRRFPAVGDIVDEMDQLYTVDCQMAELAEEREARAQRIHESLSASRDVASLLSRKNDKLVYRITFPQNYQISYDADVLTDATIKPRT